MWLLLLWRASGFGDDVGTGITVDDAVVAAATHVDAVVAAAPAEAPTVTASPLSVEARALYARTFARRGVAFLLNSLDYVEAGGKAAVGTAAAELQAAGMVRIVSADAALDGRVDSAAASAAAATAR